MLIRSLEIQGFKTFPEKTVLEFHNGITAVVGPNGSGKSNISDALRWVLGEQSVKALRCTKMEDVIFNGTPQRKAKGFAEVTLRIENRDRRLPFDQDAVEVTRRFYRSGESEYLLNRACVRLRDIHELFMDTGLGRDGYSIIGQGKIDAVVSARSEDRREIFEEAAGISRYRYRKAESERRLDAAEENLVRLRDILAELESRIGPLKEQSEKAQAFLTYSAEKKGLEIALWLHQLEQQSQALHQCGDRIALVQAQQKQAQNELDALEQALEQTRRETAKCSMQIDQVRQESGKLEEEAVKKDGEADVLQAELRHGKETENRLQAELADSAQDNARMQAEETAKTADIDACTKRLQRCRQEVETLQKKLAQLQGQMQVSQEKAVELTQKLAQFSAQATESKVAEMTAASAIEEIGLRLKQIADSVQKKENLFERLHQSKEASAKMLQEMEQRVSNLQNAESSCCLRLKTQREQAEKQRETGNRFSLDARESLRRAQLLEALERNLEGFSKSVKLVMQEARRGALTGICGPVSRLITVPEPYVVAIETALGAAMQQIVVEKEQDAKNAIRLLKQKDAGRATFLPLQTIKGRSLQETGLQDCSGFLGIASELCSSEEKYRPVRENLLGRMVVAQDLDAAVEIARRFHYRFRVVTLDGQVVNTGGSLTGGSLARNSGLLSRRSEIAKARQKAKEQQAKAEEVSAKLQGCLQNIAREEAALAQIRRELAAAREDRIHMSANREQLLKDLSGMQKDLQVLHAERDRAEKRLAQQTEFQQKARRRQAELAQKQALAQADSTALTDSRTALQQASNDLLAQMQEKRLQMLGAEKDLESLQQALQTLREQMHSKADHTDTLRKELDTVRQQMQAWQEQIEVCKQQAVLFRQQSAGSSERIAAINRRRMELEQQDTRLRQQQREKNSEKENLGRELARLEERQENLRSQYDRVAANLWAEYQLTRREAQPLAAKIKDPAKAQRRLLELKGQIRALGSVNVGAVEEYREVQERYDFLSAQVQDVEKSREELCALIAHLTRQMQEQFQQSFSQIRRNFSETFRELFGGGHADLELSDPQQVLTSGIEITVQPPGKIVSHLESLSGGEKALVAISLYFSIMKVSPPPFCMLDEIEAALDDVNVARFANYLRRMTQHTQFIVITHRRGSMEEADMLYGVTMQDEGVSQVLELHPEEIRQSH